MRSIASPSTPCALHLYAYVFAEHFGRYPSLSKLAATKLVVSPVAFIAELLLLASELFETSLRSPLSLVSFVLHSLISTTEIACRRDSSLFIIPPSATLMIGSA